MSRIAVLTDSGCDVFASDREKYNIHVLPLKITYSDGTFTDNVDIQPRDIYDRFPAQIPKTSTPNIQEVLDEVERIRAEGYDQIIAICISSGLSGTYNTVCAALSQVEDMECYAFDTRNISIGAGVFASYAAQLAEQGKSFTQIVKALEFNRENSKIFYYMDVLDYLVAGGRIGRVTGIVGSALKLKPIISCNEEGVYYTVSILRNKTKGLQKLVDHIVRFTDGRNCRLALMHGDAENELPRVEELIRKAVPQGEIFMQAQIAASLAVHTGPGLVGILSFCPQEI